MACRGATSGEVKSVVHVRCKGDGWSVTVERKNQHQTLSVFIGVHLPHEVPR